MIAPRPITLVAGANAHSRYYSEDVYKVASEPKELVIVRDADHVDLYDKLEESRPTDWKRSSRSTSREDAGSFTPKAVTSMIQRVRQRIALLSLAVTLLVGGLDRGLAADDTRVTQSPTTSREQTAMWMTVGGTHRFAMTLEDNPTARAFAQLLPLTLDMPDLNDNEKHTRLPRSLPTKAVRPGTIRTGDVMLYGSDTLVVFYKTFPSSYSYTRIGRITKIEGLAEALGAGSQRIGFTLE